MPRNAQWTPEEDEELTKLTLQNSKENNGNLDWDEIHESCNGMIVRRSKNAMISRWWKIKERQDYDINDQNNDLSYIHSNDEDCEEDTFRENGHNTDNDSEHTDMDRPHIKTEDSNRKKRKRRKKRKKENGTGMETIIHSILSKAESEGQPQQRGQRVRRSHSHKAKKYNFMEDTSSSEGGEGNDSNTVSYKNYYRHDIETLKLTSFNLSVLKPYIKAFEQQILLNGSNSNDLRAENDSLRKTVLLQNKFLTELYTKIKHQQGIVREMVECDEKLKFKLKYMNQQQSVFNSLICNSNNKYVSYSQDIIACLHKLNAKYVFNLTNINAINGSAINDLNGVIGLMHELIQILQINHSGNVTQLVSDLKHRLYSILNKTEYATNIEMAQKNGHTRKRKRMNEEHSNGTENGNVFGNPSKKQKICTAQSENSNSNSNNRIKEVISLPIINGNTNNKSIPMSLSMHVPPPLPQQQTVQIVQTRNPPPLPPPPPPIIGLMPEGTNLSEKKSGIDLLLQVAMLDNNNNQSKK